MGDRKRHLLSGCRQVHAVGLQLLGGHASPFANHPQQPLLCRDVVVAALAGLLRETWEG